MSAGVELLIDGGDLFLSRANWLFERVIIAAAKLSTNWHKLISTTETHTFSHKKLTQINPSLLFSFCSSMHFRAKPQPK